MFSIINVITCDIMKKDHIKTLENPSFYQRN